MNTAKKATEQSFAQRLQQLMDEHDPPLGIKELADAIQLSYEHTRKISRGISVPSHFIILAIAGYFGIDAAELESIAKADTFHRKFGADSPSPIFNPEVAPFATAWHLLTDSDKTDLLSRLKVMVARRAKSR